MRNKSRAAQLPPLETLVNQSFTVTTEAQPLAPQVNDQRANRVINTAENFSEADPVVAETPAAPDVDSPLALDRLIHERLRLGIISALAANQSLTFNELKTLLKTTDGNLSVHARKLEEAQYILCKKSFDGRVPKTEYQLTAAGRLALERYLNHMEALITAMREHG